MTEQLYQDVAAGLQTLLPAVLFSPHPRHAKSDVRRPDALLSLARSHRSLRLPSCLVTQTAWRVLRHRDLVVPGDDVAGAKCSTVNPPAAVVFLFGGALAREAGR